MDEILQEAIEIVKAQASVRIMSNDEIMSMILKLDGGVRSVVEGGISAIEENAPSIDPKKAIKEKSITCLECGKAFKIITKRHLDRYGLTPDEYRAKWGYAKNLPLVCKSLQRERRKTMKEMELWKRRGQK